MNMFEYLMIKSVSRADYTDFVKAHPEEAVTIIEKLGDGSEDIRALRKRSSSIFESIIEEKKRNLTEEQRAHVNAWEEHLYELRVKDAE
ncbi:hypothetical protein NKY71_25180 [Sinorhizobium meliloti]|uniref:hypothetical protein n=1 Tax=Rhizobium meliloti TaxID=382 RepID=UPI003D65505D